jgi:hypothetical protein
MNRLALNMIVGPSDGEVLNRLMSSCNMKKLFDEIVIVRTTNDPVVINVINQYADKTAYFEWNTKEYPKGNFGGARDLARQITYSEWIMWLDADDMIVSAENDLEKIFKKIHTVLGQNSDRDYFVCPYVLTLSKEGIPENVLSRERIFKRESTIQWKKPVHEQLTINLEVHKRADLSGLEILHCPTKDGKTSAARNLEILEIEYLKNVRERHDSFYYARDLVQADLKEKAVPILVDFVNTANDDIRCVYEAALILARYFMYNQGDKNLTTLCETTSGIAESYARLCLSITELNAEPFVILGDVYISQRRNSDAIRMFKRAISKQFGTGGLQDKQYYEEVPSRRLSELFLWENELEQAIWYNKIALKYSPDDQKLFGQKKAIVLKLLESICR